MKLFKLCIHQKAFSDDELVINQKDFPQVKVGDVLEIYHPDNHRESHLLLQVKTFRDDFTTNNTISVTRAVATSFNLKNYQDVHVSVVNPKEVGLDLVELVFKEQYLSRSDMLRLRKSLVGSVMYLGKSVTFAQIRVSVEEMWSKGEQVTCGYVTDDTRVTFRSSTAQVNIFIQMSCEMWDFDNYGDLYFEKTVQGYLVDLFGHWKEKNCGHDVTITMFSRTYYEAASIDEFPMYMRECIQQDYQGKFYEDFYRVVIQNERYDEWTNTIIQLKTLFHQYLDRVLKYHERHNIPSIPKARNSTAAEGNFLEVLNMGLNIYEKFYLDRNFDRTGKLSITITPGPGVFEVDRELTHITKQRTIDCGNSCDLVCMGEQPLHVTPLLKFHSKNPTISLDVGDDYNMPHWINHSFYTSRTQEEKLSKTQFIPRIRMPDLTHKVNTRSQDLNHKVNPRSQDLNHKDNPRPHKQRKHAFPPTVSPYLVTDDMPFVDYDEYDAQVFKVNTFKTRSPAHLQSDRKSQTFACLRDAVCNDRRPRVTYTAKIQEILLKQAVEGHVGVGGQTGGHMGVGGHTMVTGGQLAMASPSHPINILKKESEQYLSNSYNGVEKRFDYESVYLSRCIAGSCGSPAAHHRPHSLLNYRPTRALINPFAPSRLHFKVTSNRRRWVHAFPKDLQGATVQPHHQHSTSFSMSDSHTDKVSPPTREVQQAAQVAIELRRQRSQKQSEGSTEWDDGIAPYLGPGAGRTKKVSVTVSSSSDSGGEIATHRSIGSGIKRVSSGNSMAAGGLRSSVEQPHSDASGLNVNAVGFERDVYSVSNLSSSSGRTRTLSSQVMYSRSSSLHKELLDLIKEDDHVWLFGVTGEQEWTPEVHTGMDWKSMTRPASLPVTTDYLPNQRALHTGYFYNPYTLVPDVLNSDTSLYSNRKPLTTKQVYDEMIYQRISQGFQIVLNAKLHHLAENYSMGSSPYQGGSLRRHTKPPEELILSIGRIFHKVVLNWNEITVTQITPRYPYSGKSYHYTYRFQVPDSETYDVSWTDFRNEKLETFNWNYVDQYICTKGEDDFQLAETDKYWRARFFLLPCNNPASKKIMDGAERCDMYEERTEAEQKQMCDGFLKFLESINKIRRPMPNRHPKSSEREMKRRISLPISPLAGSLACTAPTQGAVTTDNIQPQGGKNTVELSSRVISKVLDFAESSPQTGSQLQTGSGLLGSPIANIKLDGSLNLPPTTSSPIEPRRLTLGSPSLDIIEAMKDPSEGLYFLNKQQGNLLPLPSHCFVSAEAVSWVTSHIQGVQDVKHALQLLQRLLEERLIGAAFHCGKNQRFINGFYLYFIAYESDKDKKDMISAYPHLSAYHENSSCPIDLCEVEITVTPQDWPQQIPVFMLPELPSFNLTNQKPETERRHASKLTSKMKQNRGEMKSVYVDIDSTLQSDRLEWGVSRYHAHYNPCAAFELEAQWLVATGCILGETVQGWARKAGQCGFHFLPVPGDPFALPFTPNSDPLRGPIFVPLNVDSLKADGQHLFEDFAAGSREDRLLLFKDSILKRFGFMADKFSPCQCLPVTSEPTPPTYVHCSGGMFAMIPDNRTSSPRNQDGTHCHVAGDVYQDAPPGSGSGTPVSLLHQDYITGYHANRSTQPLATITQQLSSSPGCQGYAQPTGYYQEGFLWSWNFMLSKKWRSSNTGDEHFQDKMLADFRDFCANKENRLRDYWETCKHKADAGISAMSAAMDTTGHVINNGGGCSDIIADFNLNGSEEFLGMIAEGGSSCENSTDFDLNET